MMTKVNRISFKGIIRNRNELENLLVNAGDFVVVKRGRRRLFILRCPCGCGDDLLINLDERSGPAWRLYLRAGNYSLYPSFWRDTKCKSHFIIWNNKIHWCYTNQISKEEWYSIKKKK